LKFLGFTTHLEQLRSTVFYLSGLVIKLFLELLSALTVDLSNFGQLSGMLEALGVNLVEVQLLSLGMKLVHIVDGL